MSSELKPDILQMLIVGKDCGLSMLSEAYNNYMHHYDCFFLIDKFQEQINVFVNDLLRSNLAEADADGQVTLKEISIDEALKQSFPDYVYQEIEMPPFHGTEGEVDWP